MRILHVVVTTDPAHGGPPAVAERLAAAQAALGHDVTLVSHDSPGKEEAVRKSLAMIPGMERVSVVGLNPLVRFGWLIAPDASRRLSELIDRADIVHLHGLWEPIVRHAAQDARRKHRPYLVTPHGMLDPWSLQQRRLKKKVALALVFRRILNRAACLHVLNDDEAALLKPIGLRTPMEVIPNGIFLEEIEPLPVRGAFRSTQPVLGDDPFILFLSRLHHKKGLDYLADAFAQVAPRLPTLRLVIAGPDEGAQADFEARVNAAGLASRVHVIGPIWGRDKYAAMVDASCFCLPSRQEGFSMAITEAMACGLPVVISENCHFPEVASHQAGEVTALDSQGIAEALVRVLSSPSDAEAMGRRGRDLVRSRFTWPAIAARTIDIYRRFTTAPT